MSLRCAHLLILFLLAALTMPATAIAQADDTSRFNAIVEDAKATMMIDPEKTISKSREARKIAERRGGRQRQTDIATTEWLEGEANLRLINAKAAGPLLEAAYKELKDSPAAKLKGDVLRSRGGYHAAMADVAAALSDYQAAYEIYHAIGDTRSQAIALLSIAGIYQDAVDYKSALKYYGQALTLIKQDPQLLLAVYNNRSDVLKEQGRYADSIADSRRAIDLARLLKSRVLEAQLLRNLAWTQLRSGDLSGADKSIALVRNLLRDDGEGSGAKGQYWAVAAQAAYQHGKFEDARTMIDRAFGGVDLATTTIVWWQAHKTAVDVYKRVGQPNRALAHLEALKRLDDDSNKVASRASTAVMGAQFDFANQELKIAKLREDEAKRRADTQFWVFVATSVVSAVVFGMLAFGLVTLRKSRDKVRAANVDLESSNAALGKALAAKTEFLATTSHEIRTPLNGILGMTQVMLADTRLDATLRDRIGVVHGAGVSMRALVDDILDVAKMETGNLTIERAPVDLAAMLTDVSRMWEDQAAAKGVGFALDLSNAPGRIESDPARLRQVIFNLLSNALKFTQNGSIAVTTGVEQRVGAEVVTVAIRDTGIGIPPEKLELIFESFRQADAGTTRQFGGTGLGLAICRNIARAMDGDVTVDSVPGEGSVFTLVVPLVRVAEEEAPVVADEAGQALLIVDKNPISRAMLKTLFAPRVAALKVAGSVEEALALIAAGGIERVLVDEITVAMGGDAEAGIAALASVPLTLLWTNPDINDRARLTAAGAAQIIAKPISGAALVQQIVSTPLHDVVDSRAA